MGRHCRPASAISRLRGISIISFLKNKTNQRVAKGLPPATSIMENSRESSPELPLSTSTHPNDAVNGLLSLHSQGASKHGLESEEVTSQSQSLAKRYKAHERLQLKSSEVIEKPEFQPFLPEIDPFPWKLSLRTSVPRTSLLTAINPRRQISKAHLGYHVL